ncbi:hypothetical protein [Microtetraspora niveoalba]|uniref:hypothetical protein n=1 Tax=Microtetraspora niveoalba TaxID=46175 RepID=UPI001FE16CDD|nr:hypothetical protein [Microtetraspora niveoalba]
MIRLTDGTLRVPQSLTSDDGRLIGNAYVDVVPGEPDYDRWLAESVTEEEHAERRRRWREENDDLEREFLAFKADAEARDTPSAPGETAASPDEGSGHADEQDAR